MDKQEDTQFRRLWSHFWLLFKEAAALQAVISQEIVSGFGSPKSHIEAIVFVSGLFPPLRSCTF